MNSLVLRAASRFLMTLLLLFSVFLLLRGHNEPGGGFIGGLVGAAAFTLHAIAYDVEEARRVLQIEPRHLIGAGLLLAAFSGLVGVLAGRPFLTGQWTSWELPGWGSLEVGTPLLFDAGIYLVVAGTVLTIVFVLGAD
ncbi:MAG: Na+/H+ antiporter subunit B [Kiloniellaceae bacterium]|nr:Na+/H+ antiporter subunit B [Kiloniellaceae bacterium]